MAQYSRHASFSVSLSNDKATITLRNDTRLSYALKFIPARADDREIDNFNNIPQHASIVKYYGWFRYRSWVVLGMELCDGHLKSFLDSNFYCNLDTDHQLLINWEIVKQVAAGLAACHARDLMHRDIKPDNSTAPEQCI